MALHIEENKLQGSDTHAGVQRGGGEGNAQPPAARRGAAGAPPGPQGPRRRPRLQRQHSHRRQPRRHGHNGRFTQRLSYNNAFTHLHLFKHNSDLRNSKLCEEAEQRTRKKNISEIVSISYLCSPAFSLVDFLPRRFVSSYG